MSREALLALSDAIGRFEQGELGLEDLQPHVAAAAPDVDELRSLDAALEAIVLGVCGREQRAVALEQLEPASRILRARLGEAA